MSKLLSAERNGERIDRYWLHTGDDGKDKITVQTTEDVAPVIESVKRIRDAGTKGNNMRHVASIPATVVEEACRINAVRWGVGTADVFRELMANKTDRSRRVWETLTHGRDFAKFQRTGYV